MGENPCVVFLDELQGRSSRTSVKLVESKLTLFRASIQEDLDKFKEVDIARVILLYGG